MQHQHTSKAHKFLCLFTFFFGVSFFGVVVAVVHGWTPFPSANATTKYESAAAVIPQDKPVNIETDAVLAAPKPQEIKLAEVKIVVPRSQPRMVQPGAARRMPQNVSEADTTYKPLVSPTGLASEDALNYRPSMGHPVRSPSLNMRAQGFSAPSRGTARPERETWEFEAK